MKENYKKHKKFWITIAIIFGIAFIVWAAAELSGRANALAQDAGTNSAQMETLSLQTIKAPKKAPNCNWKEEKELKKKLEAIDSKYNKATAKAKSESKATGKVSDATKQEVLNLAKEFKNLSDSYAKMWSACNCKTRSKLAAETGNTRMKSAEVAISEIDSNKLNELNAAQEKMKAAREEYIAEAKTNNEISDIDKKDIKANIIPKTTNLISNFITFVQSVTSLLSEVTSSAQDLTSVKGGIVGCATAAVKNKGTGGEGFALLNNVKALLFVAKGMLSNVQGLLKDTQSLI